MATEVRAIGLKETESGVVEPGWHWLYRTGGAAALLSALFFPIQIAIYLISPPPDTVLGWFTLFQNKPLIGLVELDLLLVADEILAILIFLALYVALRRVNEQFVTIGTVLVLASVVLFIASNPAFAMLSLSNQYGAAASDAQRAAFLAAGEGAMALWQGSSFQVAYFIGSVAPIILSVVMLRSRRFSKATAILGILANAVAFGLYVPKIGTYISLFSVVFLWVWYLLMARSFFRLGQILPQGAR